MIAHIWVSGNIEGGSTRNYTRTGKEKPGFGGDDQQQQQEQVNCESSSLDQQQQKNYEKSSGLDNVEGSHEAAVAVETSGASVAPEAEGSTLPSRDDAAARPWQYPLVPKPHAFVDFGSRTFADGGFFSPDYPYFPPSEDGGDGRFKTSSAGPAGQGPAGPANGAQEETLKFCCPEFNIGMLFFWRLKFRHHGVGAQRP